MMLFKGLKTSRIFPTINKQLTNCKSRSMIVVSFRGFGESALSNKMLFSNKETEINNIEEETKQSSFKQRIISHNEIQNYNWKSIFELDINNRGRVFIILENLLLNNILSIKEHGYIKENYEILWNWISKKQNQLSSINFRTKDQEQSQKADQYLKMLAESDNIPTSYIAIYSVLKAKIAKFDTINKLADVFELTSLVPILEPQFWIHLKRQTIALF